MKGFLGRLGWGRPAVEDDSDAMAVAGDQEKGRPGWRRHLTVNNVFFVAMLLVVGFGLARRQGIFLDSPSVQGRPQDERSVTAPDFGLPSLAGPMIRLSDHQGKVMLLNFWATWCPPCRAEMPSMEKLYQAYRDRGLVILAISSDVGGKLVVEPYVQERGLTFPVLLDPEGEVFAQYGVRGLPTSYLLDRRGRVFSADVGARDWSGKVAREVAERLLAEE